MKHILYLFAFLLIFSNLQAEVISYEFNNGGWTATSTTKNLQSYLDNYELHGESDEAFLPLTSHASQYIEFRNVEIDGVPIGDTDWIYTEANRQITSSFPYKKGMYITGFDDSPPETFPYWLLVTPSFYNGTGYPVKYTYRIEYFGEEFATTPQSVITASVDVPDNHNLQITGLLHQVFTVTVWKHVGGLQVHAGQYSGVLNEVETLPNEQPVTHHITEGEEPPFIEESQFLPEWPEAPGYIPQDGKVDKVEESYSGIEDESPGVEATNDEIVGAIKQHDHNRKEEQASNETLWTEAEEAQNKRFDELDKAQKERDDEAKAWLAAIQQATAAGHANTNNSINEFRAAVDAYMGDEESANDPGEAVVPEGPEMDGEAFDGTSTDMQTTVANILGLLPDPQAFPTVTGRNYDFDITMGTFKGEMFTAELDLSPYTSIIELIRTLEAALVSVMFVLALTNIVRGGFA